MKKVTLIKGDGIGPEISKSVVEILEKAGAGFKKGMNTVSNKVAGESLFNNLSSNKSIAENIREFTYDLLELGDVPFVKANYVQRLASAIEAENKARVKMGGFYYSSPLRQPDIACIIILMLFLALITSS